MTTSRVDDVLDEAINDAWGIRETAGGQEAELYSLTGHKLDGMPTVTVEYDPTCADIPLEHLLTLTGDGYELELRATLKSVTRCCRNREWLTAPQWEWTAVFDLEEV